MTAVYKNSRFQKCLIPIQREEEKVKAETI